MYGYRGRIGLIVPSSNTTNESEFWRWAPEGVSIHTARMELEGVNEQELTDMAADVADATGYLATADVDAIAFGCTTGSLVKGAGYDEEIEGLIREQSGVPGVSTSSAIMRAFEALDAESLAIATPYTDTMNEKEVSFLESNGYDVTAISGLGIEPNVDIGRQGPDVAYRLARETATDAADVMFVSCTNFRTLEIIEHLERDLETPVVSSNQATFWATLGAVGLDTTGISLGRLGETSL